LEHTTYRNVTSQIYIVKRFGLAQWPRKKNHYFVAHSLVSTDKSRDEYGVPNMKVERFPPDPETEPRHWVRHDQAFAMMLRPGSIEWGSQRSALEKFDYTASDLALCDRHVGEWVGLMNVQHLQLGISDAALMACSDGAYGEVELRASRKFADPRLSAMAAAVHAEMVSGFPGGRLFLDSVEQAMAVTLVNGHAVRHRPVQIYRGGLGSARLRRIKELVHAKMEFDLSLDEMAQAVGLSTAHFARMFRKSTGATPHQFVLRQRLERAKAMLRDPDARVLDVAVACGFKTQQHFAQVFRDALGVSPSEYRQDLVGSEATWAPETGSEDASRLVIAG
jgi:AraC family transcriptional regulator